jgi:MFS family permease
MAGPLMERIGRKKCLMLVSMSNYAVGFACILLADRAEFIYVGRCKLFF